jgi:cyclohexanone monooxygenase
VEVRGRVYELDCLIFATGFEVGTDYSRRAAIELIGSDGESLTEAWAQGVRTLHGMHVHGFPNCFIMSNAQAGFTVSYPHLLDEQAKHIAYIVETATRRGCSRIEVSQQGEAEWVQKCIDRARDTGDFLDNCTPGYYNNEGKTGDQSAQNGLYGGGSIEFFRLLQEWRASGSLQGLAMA